MKQEHQSQSRQPSRCRRSTDATSWLATPTHVGLLDIPLADPDRIERRLGATNSVTRSKHAFMRTWGTSREQTRATASRIGPSKIVERRRSCSIRSASGNSFIEIGEHGGQFRASLVHGCCDGFGRQAQSLRDLRIRELVEVSQAKDLCLPFTGS
jgi:hypothetical protein